MSFKQKMRKAMGRGSSSAGSPVDSTTVSMSPSVDVSGVNSPRLSGSTSGSPVEHDLLTIDPRENTLARVETSATAKKRSALARLRSAMKKEDPYKDWPEDIYKPHEVPRSKYRRPPQPEHTEALQAYSLRSAFAANLRRRSYFSQYSPMASRLPSRMGSFSSKAGRSAAPSRSHSIVGQIVENAGDDNLANVGISRQHTNEEPSKQSRRRGDTVTTVPDLVQSSSINSGSSDSESTPDLSQLSTIQSSSRPGGLSTSLSKPIDEEELSRAITQKLIVSNQA